MPANSILPPLAEEELIKKAAAAWSNLFGSEDERFTAGIKKRRMETEIEKAGLSQVDPTNFMGPNPEVMMAGVTKYLNSAAKPDRLARMIGTETFKNKMSQMGIGGIGERFASRYPRIAAHMNPRELTSDTGISGRAYIGTPLGRYNPTVPVEISTALNPNVDRTLAHEATHVAQRLGMGERMVPAYQEANKVYGYDMNPFEQSANNAAFRYSSGNRSIPPKTLSNITELIHTNKGELVESPMINYIKSFFK